MDRQSDFRTRGSNSSSQDRLRRFQHGGTQITENESDEPEPDDEYESGPVAKVIDRNPFAVGLTAFGLGLGFGLGLTLLLTRREETWFERSMPESIQNLPEQLRRVPEYLGSRAASWAKR